MCGIAGYVRTRANGPNDSWLAWLGTVSSSLAHRGPDEEGHFVGENVGFAFTRLSLVGLAAGAQPISNENKDLWLICNGEIFNHRALRSELIQRGHRFQTESDTEVIVHLYEELGMRLVDRLDGQFAFALFDAKRGVTFLVRDHFGICPLFFSEVSGGLIFASEVPALLMHEGRSATLDLVGLDQVMTLPGLVSPRTMFQGVRSVAPGTYIAVQGAAVSCHQYWDLEYPTEEEPYLDLTFEEWADAFRSVLAASVASRVAADVPVGAYLSGGLDSSLVATLATQALGKRLPLTASIVYSDEAYDESPFSDIMAGRLSDRHIRTGLSVGDIASGLRNAVIRSASSLRESYNVSSFVLSKSFREGGGKAAIGGEGADELFAGYPGYRFDRLRDQGLLEGAAPSLEERELRNRAWGDDTLRYEHDLTKSRFLSHSLYTSGVSSALGEGCFREPLVDHTKVRGRHRVHQRSYLDVKLRLGDHLLGDHGDRMAMANGVELRYPFLSRGVAELAVRMPPDMKLRGNEEKAVVRRAAQGLVPDAVRKREKYSWAAHGSSSLLRSEGLSPVDTEMMDYLLSDEKIDRDGLFDAKEVAALRARQSHELFNPNGLPDLLMVVLTTGILIDHFGVGDIHMTSP